jgi:hypothetical protein
MRIHPAMIGARGPSGKSRTAQRITASVLPAAPADEAEEREDEDDDQDDPEDRHAVSFRGVR